ARYRIFGLTLRANREIPGLLDCTGESQDCDIEVIFEDCEFRAKAFSPPNGQAWYVSKYLDEDGAPALRVWRIEPGRYLWCYTDGARFLIEDEGLRIRCTWAPPVSFEDVVSYLSGPVLGATASLRSVGCLHASAVVLNGRAFAFAGDSGL